MRVMFITPTLSGGGAERVTSILASYYAEFLHCSVKLIVCKWTDGEYPVSSGVDILHVQTGPDQPVGHLARNCKLKSEIRLYHPDLIISIASYYTFLLGTGAFDEAPVILSQRFDPKRFDEDKKRLIDKKITEYVYKKAKGIVFQTEEMREYFGPDIKRKSTVILNPVRQLFAGEPEQRRKAVVTFCRICKQKNLPLLVDSFSDFYRTHTDYSLEIYGEGPEKESLIKWCEENYPNLPVLFSSFRRDIHEVVRDASVFVSSSDYEGLSNSMLEAMSLGLPVISTDSAGGGARSVIKDGKNGILIPCNDKDSLTSALCRLADEESLGKRLSSGAIEFARSLSPDKICDQWREFAERNSQCA